MLGHFLQSEVSFGPKYNGKSLKTFEFELSSMRRVDHYKSVWGTGNCLYDDELVIMVHEIPTHRDESQLKRHDP